MIRNTIKPQIPMPSAVLFREIPHGNNEPFHCKKIAMTIDSVKTLYYNNK